ncbi:MAG: chromosome segregation protein SMC [Pseudoramibacter sp.]|nr:chromosome segregation protein SMC [Pseudoramibacter sp.]
MTGFKSFAQPVELTFDPHITAVIGPNGSGKSNIIDAVRWILGEQNSRSLRGRQMEDIIFSGTDSLKPMGYTEVVAILNNEDHYLKDYPDEVSVSRRLFRTGESLYYINKQRVRLKDIHLLFADTGLGKNGYSVVSQGSVEDIVKSDPHQLRNIIEEAVGIVNYRISEHDAEKELITAQRNMDRIKDILSELNRQRQPLIKQSDKARHFLKLKEQLKALDLYKYTKDNESFAKKERMNRKAVCECQKEIKNIKIKIHDADARYQRLRNQKKTISDLRHQTNQNDKNFSLRNADAEKNKIRIEEKIKTKKAEQKRLEESIAEIIDKKNNCIQNIENIQNFLKEIQQQNQKFEVEQQFWQNKSKDQTQKIQQKQEELSAFHDARDNSKTKKDEYYSKLAALDEKIKIREQNADDYAENQVEIKRKIDSEESNIDEYQKKLAERKEISIKEKRYLVDLVNSVQVISSQIDQRTQNLNHIKSKIEFLNTERNKFITYSPAVRWMMNKKNSMAKPIREKILGTVEELIEIPRALVPAITLALGRKNQNIIVYDTETAKFCIQILKKKKIGRVTFLPLNNMRTIYLQQKEKAILRSCDGYVGVASDLIKFPEIIKPAVQNLLGRVVVAQNFTAAQSIRKVKKNITIVTVDGELFYPGGAISGGITKYNKGHVQLSYKAIEDLQKEKKQIMDEMANNQRTYYQIKKKISGQQKRILALNSKQRDLEQELYRHKQSLTSLETLHVNIQKQIVSNRQEYEKLLKNQKEIREIIQKLNSRIKEHNAIQSPDELQNKINILFKEQREYDQSISKYQIKIEKNKEIIKQKNIELQKIIREKEEISSQINEKKEDLENCRQTIQQLQQQFSEMVLTLQKYQQDLTKQIKQSEQYEAQENKIELEIEKSEKEIRLLNHQQILQNDELNKLTLAYNRIESIKKNIDEKMQNRYGMNAVMILDWMKTHEVNVPSDLEISIRSLERQINELGTVNVNAIENFEIINQRYRFLQNQYKDLLESKEKINNIINELQTSMAHKFDSEFKQLQVYFSKIFNTLFEGGQAQLYYIDPQDILHSGIGLKVQPPGKNVKQLSLLSGGEKALTAICLLFAFIKLNPSPFCIVDEVDAALDEQNIYRFTEYLKGLAHQTQFIIITHRKNTLKICDSIYGVSMSNTGISKVISMKVSDYL